MKIALIGYGKMGKAIEQVLLKKNEQAGKTIHQITHKITSANIRQLTPENLSQADVAIEFSAPAFAVENISKCFDAHVPVVVGTTGWLDDLDKVTVICKQGNHSLFWAPNFSIGVNLFFEVNKHLAKLMDVHPQYDVTLEEIHHTSKLDAPSGTAIHLANQVLKNLSRKSEWVNQATQNDAELSIISKREPNVPGTHTVSYQSPIDSIEIKHTAHSREGFAEGAVLAAEWLIGKQGVFTMKDMLGLG